LTHIWKGLSDRARACNTLAARLRPCDTGVSRPSIHATERVVGPVRLAKLARLVNNEVRLDGENDMRFNGEAIVQKVARSFAAPVVLDVGAHFGEWSESLLAQAGNTPTLHAFEPSAFSAAKARDAIRGRGEVHQFALSDKPGVGALFIVHEGAGSNSVVAFTDRERPSGDVENIVFSTLDDFCAEHGIERVTLLKIDAEGHDLAVLRGAQSMLGNRAIDLIQFEYNLRWIDARVFLLDAFELLEGFGYRLGKVTPHAIETYDRWHVDLEKFVECNYLAFLPEQERDLPTTPWWGGLPL
jgi:FkbM family methyltransferase